MLYYVDGNMLHVEKMEVKDYSFAVQLSDTSDWKLINRDFEFMNTIEPLGCFVLYDDSQQIGIATTVCYDKIGWFGNLIIKKEYRNRGSGSILLHKAITYLRSKNVQKIGIFTYPKLTGFYEQFGFKKDKEFIVFQGNPAKLKDLETINVAKKDDFSKLLAFDKDCLGFNREKTLNLLFSDKNNIVFFSTQNNFIKGYIVLKIFNDLVEIGPLVVRSNFKSVVIDLITKALCNLSKYTVLIYVPINNEEIINLLLTFGLKKDTALVRMFLGSPINIDCEYLPESLERG